MNQYSSNHQPSQTLWYTPTPQKPFPFVYHNHLNHINPNYDDADSDNSTTNANNTLDRSETASSSAVTTLDKEHMFEKPLTPSDVGKLNRLVIPKQHAEKYLPLAAAAASNTTSEGGAGSGGLLLGFEDETGKCWRFRYSYWNSSQSYVLTKGWSRYVKEKKLDAGDVVLFERHRFEPDRFFIGWRRRGSNPPVQPTVGWTSRSSSYNFSINNNPNHNHQGYNNNNHIYYNNNHLQNVEQSPQCYAPSHQVSAFTNFLPQGKAEARQKSKKSGISKRVRLFGVNLECQLEEEDENIIIDDEPQTSDGSSLSSQGQGQGLSLGSASGSGSGSRMGPTSYNYIDYVGYPPNNHDHMDMNYSVDVNQHMRNRLG